MIGFRKTRLSGKDYRNVGEVYGVEGIAKQTCLALKTPPIPCELSSFVPPNGQVTSHDFAERTTIRSQSYDSGLSCTHR